MAKDFSDIIQNFATSLEDLVEELKEQNKKDPTELLNHLVNSIDENTLNTIVEDVKVIKENVQIINKNTDKILEVVKEQKKAKETGMFGEIENKSNKDKIIGAVKTTVLIAAGVLAIGMAFKIVGDVDFLSVVSLGMGIIFTAYAFSKVASIKDDDGKLIDLKRATQIGLVMVVISGAILVSGLLLKMMPVLELKEIASIIGVGVGIGAATYFILKGMKNIKSKDIPKLMKAPIILPIIALAVVASSWILKGVTDISLWSVIKASLAIGLTTLMMLPTIYALQKMKLLQPTAIADLIIGIGAIALISTAIMVSSWILSIGNYDGNYPSWQWSLGVGLAMITFAAPMMTIGMIIASSGGIGLVLGLVAVPLIAIAIVVTSYILQAGSYDNPVPLIWAIGTGLLMLTFGATMVVLGATLPFLIIGAVSMSIVALSIVATSYILQAGSYDNPVPLIWAIGTDILMLTFGATIVALGAFLPFLIIGAVSMSIVAISIAATSYILQAGSYEKYPEYDWSLSVGLLMIMYGATMVVLGATLPFLILGAVAMGIVALSIVATSAILSKGTYNTYPGYEWSLGVGLAIYAFGAEMIALGAVALLGFGLGFVAIGAGLIAVLMVADAIQQTSHILAKGTYSNGSYPSEEWAKGVGGAIMAFAKALAIQSGMNLINSFFGGDNVDLSAFIIKISNAILTAGMIFGAGGSADFWNNGSYPGADWAKGVGGAITAFAYALQIQSDSGGWFSDNIDFSAFIIKVSKAILKAGELFSNNGFGLWSEGSYPGADWAKGVGETISAFADTLKAQSDASSWWSGEFDFAEFIISISEAIISAGALFTEDGFGLWNEGTYPNSEWSKGIGDTLSAFAEVIKKLGDSGIDVEGDAADIMIELSEAMIEIGELFSESNPSYWDTQFTPTKEWGENIANTITQLSSMKVDKDKIFDFISISEYLLDAAEYLSQMKDYPMGNGIIDFSSSIEKLMKVLPNDDAVDPFLKLVNGFKELSDISWIDLMTISTVSDLIEDLVESLDDLSENKVESLLKLGAGFQLISLINQQELEKVLDVLEDKTATITNIVDEDSFVRTFLDEIFSNENTEDKTTSKQNTAIVDQFSPFEKELLEHVEKIDKNIAILSTSQTKHDEKEEIDDELESKNVED